MNKNISGGWQAHVQPSSPGPVPFIGTRFDVEGRFLPEIGNTVVRHVVPGSDTQVALVELREALQALPYSDHFAFTDVDSYHMTVFEGVITSRRDPAFWPNTLATNTSIDETTAHFDARLADFEGCGPFDMMPVEVTPFGLVLTGATDRNEATARAWRDALTVPLALRGPKHDQYFFHTTMAYIKKWLPDEALPIYSAALAELTVDFLKNVPIMALGPTSFCSFQDMNAFPIVRKLEQK